MKPKLGRPKIPKAEARSIFVITRVNAAEAKQINAAIKASKLPKTAWARNALLSAASNGSVGT
jgi:hypothetical protein